MDVKLFFEIAFKVIGGLGVFLLGMKHMSEGLQAIAGDRLRKMISAITNNRFMGVITGLLVTCLVQSSSVTTVMVVGFVNSSIMSLMQAIGVILGANIGTTITGWILVLKIGKYGLPMLGIAAFIFLFSKKDRLRYIGMAIMGIGMVFFGLELMKNGFKPLTKMDGFEVWFHMFNADTYFGILKCALVGMILTMIVQSSSATLGITIGLASVGAIEFPTAAALVLGENIGTTVTALLASIGTTTNAKRAAYAHFFFNVLGTCWFIVALPLAIIGISNIIEDRFGYDPRSITMESVAEGYFPQPETQIILADGTTARRSADEIEKEQAERATQINAALADIEEHIESDPKTKAGIAIQKTYEQIKTAAIATTHSAFNIINVLLFLPLVGLLAKLVTRLVPEKETKEVGHLTYLDIRMLDTPAIGIVQSQKQLDFMAESVDSMMDQLQTCLNGQGTTDLEGEIFHREEILDNVQKEIFLFLSNMVSGQVPHDVTANANMQMRLADEYESLSDYTVSVLKGLKRMEKNGLELDAPAREKLLALHDRTAAYISKVNLYMKDENAELLSWAMTEGTAITKLMKDLRTKHLERLQNEEVSPLFSLAYTDMLNFYRRMKDHALNIAEVVAGEK